MSPAFFSASQIGLMLFFTSSMNAVKCPGRIWTSTTRSTGPSVYWSCAVAVARDTREKHSAATASRKASFMYSLLFFLMHSSVPYPQCLVKRKSCPIQDEPEGGGSFQHKMSLERVAC